MSKLTIKVHESNEAPNTPKELKDEMAKVVSDFCELIGEHKGFDRYSGDVAYYIDDFYGNTPEDKVKVLNKIDQVSNGLLQLRAMIASTPLQEAPAED